MSQNVDQLSQLLLEADGLLLLLQRHRDETPIDAIKLLRKKLELILALTDGLDEESLDDTQEPADTSEYIEETIEQAHQAPTDDTTTDDTQIIDSIPTYTTADSPIVDAVTVYDDTETETEATLKPTAEDPTAEPDYDSPADPAYESPAEPAYESPAESNHEAAPAPRRHISNFFNLNDKFRFRRELFGNSDAQYVECLDMLSAMNSISEATEYLYDDLGWDPNNEDVRDFVAILSNFYN